MSKDKAAALTNEQKIRYLRAAIIEGEASGPATAFDMNDFLASNRDNHFTVFTE
jgi:Arc/MetJ-type ribon-helix-helix transcriptional regulator